MLKTSPILSPPAGSSPSRFRHAPSRRPHSRSTRSTTALASASASSSAVSMASGPAPAPASVMASATTAPLADPTTTTTTTTTIMGSGGGEPQHPTHPSSAVPCQPVSTQHEPPPEPRPSPMTTTAPTSPAPGCASSSPPSKAHAQQSTTASPNKRRSHPAHDASNTAAAAAAAQGGAQDVPSDGITTQQSCSSSPKNVKRIKSEEQPPRVLPQKYELCPVEDMVELIAHMLGELITTNDAIRISSDGLTRFHSRTAPGISVRDYLHRLAKHATIIPPLLLAMVYYIDRLCALYQEFTINTLTVHRFLITAATVAAKGLSDSFWNNATYARVGGVRVAELKLLELEFLYRVDWKIVPNPEVLVAYYQGLVQRTPGYTLGPEEAVSDGEIDKDEVKVEDKDGDDDGQQQVGNSDK